MDKTHRDSRSSDPCIGKKGRERNVRKHFTQSIRERIGLLS